MTREPVALSTDLYAPPSKKVTLDARHESPQALIRRLVRRWDRDDALVLADWLEEVGFPGFAQQLRRKSWEEYTMRRVVDEIASGMGFTTPRLRGDDRWKTRGKRETDRISTEETKR